VPCRDHTSKALRYGTRSQWISQFYLQTPRSSANGMWSNDCLLLCVHVGADDLKMCELSLEDTGLTRKRGAEIFENDFEQEWAKHGGNEHMKSVLQQVSSKFLQMKLGIAKK